MQFKSYVKMVVYEDAHYEVLCASGPFSEGMNVL